MQKNSKPYWERLPAIAFMALLVLDVTLIALHVALGWSLFDLDQEGNLSAWYSSAKLLTVAFIAALVGTSEPRPTEGGRFRFRWLWFVVAIIFIGLSADETASMHERISRCVMEQSSVGLDIRETVLGGDEAKDSFAWVLLLSPFILVVATFLLVFFYRRLKPAGTGFYLAIAGIGCFLLAVGMEATIFTMPSFSEWTSSHLVRYRTGIALEESGEIFGTTFLLIAFWRYLVYAKLEAARLGQ